MNIGRRTCPKPKLSLKGAPLDRSCKWDGATLRFVIMAFRSSLMFLFISVSMRKANFFMWILSFVSPKFNNSVSRHSLYSSFSLQKTSVPCVIRMCVFFASPIFCLTFPSHPFRNHIQSTECRHSNENPYAFPTSPVFFPSSLSSVMKYPCTLKKKTLMLFSFCVSFCHCFSSV